MSAHPAPQNRHPVSICLSSRRILDLIETNTMKNLWLRIVGELWAVLWGIECWWRDRPIHHCPVCNEWQPREHTHPVPRDPAETRRDLLIGMRFDPDFGAEMLRCLRDVPEFAEFVAQTINLPDPPRNEDPLAVFRRKSFARMPAVSETLGHKSPTG